MPEYRLKAFFNDGRTIVDTDKTLHVFIHSVLFNKEIDVSVLCQELLFSIIGSDSEMTNLIDDLEGSVLNNDIELSDLPLDLDIDSLKSDIEIIKKMKDMKING